MREVELGVGVLPRRLDRIRGFNARNRMAELAQSCTLCPPLSSHLQGMFFRTVKMLESGMKPV